MTLSNAKKYIKSKFHFNDDKINLIEDVISNQGELTTNDNNVHFYVHIPFCPTRCSYCSFITFDNKNNEEILHSYLNALIKEIDVSKEFIKTNNLNVDTVYVGGGTPTTLSVDMLDKLMSSLNFNIKEFTVECGRPDTITIDKLMVLKKHGVSRICINPQTFHDKTLKTIGRQHTTQQTILAYNLAKELGFIINMDLIAGLPNETNEDFKFSLHSAIDLNPDNITIHTLSIKNGAELMEESFVQLLEQDVTNMVNYARKTLKENNYFPYYLYKQKHQLSSQENIGYTKKEKACKFNIESMEETASIIACGAGAISKRVFHAENRIERCANIKAVPIYIERLDQVILRKKNLFS